MKLLFDQNISHQVKDTLLHLYPDSLHVKDLEMSEASDESIWEYAKRSNYLIISKDSDFHQRSFVLGHPPKVIWIKTGNCSTATIISLLIKLHKTITTFANDQSSSFLIIE